MNLLVVTYYYPPTPGSGSVRWDALSKYLRRMGHTVTVLTRVGPGTQPGSSGDVVRVPDLDSNPALRRILRRPPLEQGTSQPTYAKAPPALLTKVLVPDAHAVSWSPQALLMTRRLIRERAIDCVITSSPPSSTHLIGLALGARRPAWIADFRDGWCFEPLRPPFPTRAQRALDRALERRVTRAAEETIGVTAPIVEDFQSRLGVAAELVSNGFDPELTVASFSPPGFEERHLTFVHTGSLSGPRGRDPRPLLLALRRLIDAQPELVGRLRLVVAGPSEADEQAMLDEVSLGDVVQHLGYVPRSRALSLQRAAGTLLLITSRDRCEATGKIYEYIAAGRPIVALAEGNEAARIVAETNTGVLVAPQDVDAISRALGAAISGELERAYAPRGIERFSHPLLAERMAVLAERAVQRRAQAGVSGA